MKCRKASQKLNAYLDGELSQRTAAGVREHLEVCAQCAGELAEMERLNRALGADLGVERSLGLAVRIRRRAQERAARRQPVPIGALLRVRLATAVAAVLVMGVGVTIGGLMSSSVSAIEVAREGAWGPMADADLQLSSLSAAPPTSMAAVLLELGGDGN